MRIIPKHITTTIISTILVILLILMGLEVLISFIGQLGKIGHGNYTLVSAMLYVLLDMPYQLYNFFPMASLIGSLLGLGLLADQNELTVMQASGFSKGEIIFTVLKAAVIMVLITMVLGEVVAPYAEYKANLNREIALSGGQALQTGHGAWIRQQNHFIHVDSVVSKTDLMGVTIYTFDHNHQLVEELRAKDATVNTNGWLLKNTVKTVINSNQIKSSKGKNLLWPVHIASSVLSASSDIAQSMSLVQLYHYIAYLNDNGLQASQYEMNFWKRIFQPLATAVMVFLALPFVFGSLRSVTMGVRVLTGVTIGFLFYILNQFFAPISLLYQVPPFIGAALPVLLFLTGAIVAVLYRRQ